jgi:hypothetical protein
LHTDYFSAEHFDQGMSVVDDAYFRPSVDYPESYDLNDTGMDTPHSTKKRRADSLSGKGLSRISSRISTISNRWRSNRVSDGPDALDAIGSSRLVHPCQPDYKSSRLHHDSAFACKDYL